MKKYILFLLFFYRVIHPVFAQDDLDKASVLLEDSLYLDQLRTEYGQHKIYPREIEKPLLFALSFFPELKKTEIHFEYSNSASTLMAKPTLGDIFLKQGKRKFSILISQRKGTVLEPILFHHLPLLAQIGILGHELSHISDFDRMKGGKILCHALRYTFSKKYGDQFEYNTDRICIQHGLGKALWTYSDLIRNTFQVKHWAGAANFLKHGASPVERYMDPDTIEKEILK